MKLSDFDFRLPPELIAQEPARPRDSARLLHVTPAALADLGVRDLPDLLRPSDLMVVNDTAVIPARLRGERMRIGSMARIEATLHRRLSGDTWIAFVRPAKRLKPNDTIRFGEDFVATVDAIDGGEATLRFDRGDADLRAALDSYGSMPLPPYIKRPAEGGGQQNDQQDRTDYQTAFARREGAVAAPTASLHFTDTLLAKLDARGIERATVTLHVGAGTFLPVKVDDPDQHRMHAEWGEVPSDVAARITAAKREGRRIVPVGTTALRLIESAADEDGTIRPFEGDTDIFIRPGHRFRATDMLMTNFHLPKSTLFMLVAALMGLDRMKEAYAHAIGQDYRFFSYGDATLLEPNP